MRHENQVICEEEGGDLPLWIIRAVDRHRVIMKPDRCPQAAPPRVNTKTCLPTCQLSSGGSVSEPTTPYLKAVCIYHLFWQAWFQLGILE